jgi:hypothetical protein
MSAQVETPPYRRNPDWYRAQYRLASTLSNQAFTKKDPSMRQAGFTDARLEVDKLLRACWSMLEPLPLERLMAKRRKTRKFIANTVVPAGLNLKAFLDLELGGGTAGKDEEFDLRTVIRRLRRGKSVSPLTIVEAVVAKKKESGQKLGPSLLLDLACFFYLSKDEARAQECVKKAFEMVPAAERDRLRARAAADPTLKTIPGIVVTEKRRCHWSKRESDGDDKPPRPWF